MTFDSFNPETETTVHRKIDHWKSRLLDFTRRNRLLYFKVTQSSTAEITHPTPLELFDRLVVKGKTFVFPNPDEETTEDEVDKQNTDQAPKPLGPLEIGTTQTGKQMHRVLYNLRTRSRTAREEQGVNILFLVFGFLNWKDAPHAEISQAPLILVPVDLTREAPGQPYQLTMLEEDIVINPTLQAWLKQSHNIDLPELPEDLDAEGLERYWELVNSVTQPQNNWEVDPKVVLSILSYQKQMMVVDLEQNRKELAGHPLIRSMSVPGLFLPRPDVEPVQAGELDDRIAPETTFQVLDADSSQQEAIQAAKAGLSFLLQGPPGTGKSQTIANIIAEFLGEGKRVLFVSAKMAALEVVQRRLNKVGLGDFCLQLHSFRRDKREIVEELGKSLDARHIPSPGHLDEKLTALKLNRQKLNAYVRALHQPRHKLGISVFQAYGELARLVDAPRINFSLENIENLTPEAHNTQREIVSQLAAFPQVIDVHQNHPWLGCQITDLSLQLQGQIANSLERLLENIRAFAAGTQSLARMYQVKTPENLNEGWELVQVALFYHPGILQAPVADLHQRFASHYQIALRYLRPQYWKDSALMKAMSFRQVRPHPKQAVRDLDLAKRLQKRRSDPSTEDNPQASQIQSLANQLHEIGQRIKTDWDFLRQQFYTDQQPDELTNFFSLPIESSISWCLSHLDQLPALVDWAQFNRVHLAAQKAGLSSFVSTAIKNLVKASHWPDAFLRQFYTLWVDSVVRCDEALMNFHGSTHQVLVDQFRQLDQEQIILAQQQLRTRILERRPQAGWMSVASSEEAILRRELNKKRRLKPLRKLFNEIPDLILALRPCLMMSPLTVSQLLNPDLFRFDLVIFDEASQIHPEEAVGAIIRARQAIIVGDRHQLPPTSFFEIIEVEDDYNDDNNLPDDFESLLNECDAAGLPNKMLLWHYRSRDESLIAFSNHHFYQNRLLTFPASIKDPVHTGIEFIYIPDGIYKRGGRYNEMEAKQVVDLILAHYRDFPNQSLGVVTFSQAQRDVVQMALDQELMNRADLQKFFSDDIDEPFFVKNLELVQGDERDVMIFSVGYGKDETGRFILNFGPLNRDGGERRLNVAVTRARQRVKLVASIQPEDIDLARTESRGVKLLRSYMTLARDGLPALYGEVSLNPEADFESPFEESVYHALTAKGLRLQKQVGVSHYRIDMAVVDPQQPGRFLLGIECDGAMYHSAPTARDRDRLRQQVLENLGWRIHRIWSRDWIENQHREITKVLNYLEDINHGWENPSSKPISPPAQNAAVQAENLRDASSANPGETKPISGGSGQPGLPPEASPYSCAHVRAPYHGVEGFRRATPKQLQEMLKSVVENEGPIVRHLAKRRITDAFGITRVGARMDRKLEDAIYEATLYQIIRRSGNFLWPKDFKPVTVRVPGDSKYVRSIEEIPPEELQEGVFLCVKSALSMDTEDLVKQTAKLFGLKANANTALNIKFALSELLQSRRLEKRGDKIRLPR